MQDLWVLFLFYIEEAAAAVFLGLSLLGNKPSLKNVISIGVLQGIIVWLVRFLFFTFNIPLGLHVLLTLISLIIIVRFITKISWGLSSAVGLMSFITIIISEVMLYPWAYKLFGLNVETANNSPFWHIVTAYIGDSLMFLLAFVVGLTKFSLIKMK